MPTSAYAAVAHHLTCRHLHALRYRVIERVGRWCERYGVY